MFLLQKDRGSDVIRYASAGHRAYLIRASGNTKELNATGLPLGVISKDYASKVSNFTLQRGDTVILYTDGVVECRASYGRQLGVKRLVDVVHSSRHKSSRAIFADLHEAVCRYVDGQPLSDDYTVIVLKREK